MFIKIFYRFIYLFPVFLRTLGEDVSVLISRSVAFLFHLIKVPLSAFIRILGRGMKKLGRWVSDGFYEQVGDERYFTGRLYRGLKMIFHALVKAPSTLPAVLNYYFRRAISQYTRIAEYAVLYLLPLGALLLMLGVIGHFLDASIALRIDAGGVTLGYVAGESDYLQARNLARTRLGLDSDYTANTVDMLPDVTYTLTLININQYTGTEKLCDNIIENSDSNIVSACGIYIDDKFLCAVKNEADARRVFDAVLENYADYDGEGMLSFKQSIDYVEGLYPDTENIIWDSARLAEKVSSVGSVKTYYTTVKGDSYAGIAEKYGITVGELSELNPDINLKKTPKTDTRLLVKKEAGFLSVKVVKTEVYNETVAFGSLEVPSDALFEGTKRTVVTGVNGTDQVTALVTYIDGEKKGVEEVSRLTLQEPIDERIQVGTKSLEGSYNVSSFGGVLVWPAVNAYNINSPYGYRWGKMHTAIDIGSAAGTSLGKLVVAAAEGTVVTAGVHSSYGYYVKIDHGGGMQTLYAHCMAGSLMVSVGEHVSAGQAIARIGQTGYATGPHLHFEVIINGDKVNPSSYLGIN